jgi:hypothetical protein
LDNRNSNRKESAVAHQDQEREGVARSGAGELLGVFQSLLAEVDLQTIALRTDCTWCAFNLLCTAILWAWSDESTLGERFKTARKIIGFAAPTQDKPAGSYQAFIKLLRKWTEPFSQLLTQRLRAKMEQSLADWWTVAGWVVMACDGSRIDVPRTEANEARYSPRSKLSRAAQRSRARRKAKRRTAELARQRKANVPQIWLTMLWHAGTGLSWDWRTGPSDSSERAHLQEMLSSAPANSLITADAGFVGYGLWQGILASGRQFLIRVGSNVTLLKKLGYVREQGGLVYLWPNRAAKQHQPPLVLRLIVVHTGRHPVYLVTSVRIKEQLSDKAAAEIYGRRWGIEVFYRHCKQTFERRKLRSQNPDNAMLELQWSLLGMWAMGLHSHHHLLSQGVTSPQRISFAAVLRAYRRSMREYKSAPDPGDSLEERLDRSLTDTYKRKNKTSRDYCRKKHETATGAPIIQTASQTQIDQAKQFNKNQTVKGLTA